MPCPGRSDFPIILRVDFERSSGILLHLTCLPGRFGIGDLGASAYRFVDFLAAAKQSWWQILPLGPTGYGNSPYQCHSAFAGNPLLISLELLRDEGLLETSDLQGTPTFSREAVDFGRVIRFKRPLLEKSFQNFTRTATASQKSRLESFCRAHAEWLRDYSLFMAIKEEQAGRAWTEWGAEIVSRRPEALKDWRRKLAFQLQSHQYFQYQFFEQWQRLHRYCGEKRIRLMGDIPIFVAHDSADVWAHPEMFRLDSRGGPLVVAGVPPDYFSATGQIWGNPLYRWEEMARSDYQWWTARLRNLLSLVEAVRLDHFRGFSSFWEVPATHTTAANGRWNAGPGAELFQAARSALGDLPVVAENLGVITPEVEDLRRQLGFPGMAVLQFGFGKDFPHSSHLPHNHHRDLVAYTGTHDNDTIVGWWRRQTGDGGKSARLPTTDEGCAAAEYLNIDGQEVHWTCIRALLASVASLAITPLQDVLGLGSHARMNCPSEPGGNWKWRFREEMLEGSAAERLAKFTGIYGRQPTRSDRRSAGPPPGTVWRWEPEKYLRPLDLMPESVD